MNDTYRARCLFTALSLLLIASCGQRSAPGSDVRSTIDPDGIRAVENGPIPRQWNGTLPLLRLEELAVIGAAEGPDEQIISNAYRFMRVSTGPDGQVGYIERQPAELRVYDGEGNFLWRAGRSGEGPGEWRNASYLTHMEGTGWILTTYPYRLVTFDEEGTLIENRSLQDVPGIRSSMEKVLHPSGAMWSWKQDAINNIESYGHVFRGNWKTLECTKIDSMPHSILEFEGTDSAYLKSLPYSMSADTEGRLWLYHSLDYQIEVYGVEGDDRWRVRREFEPVPYTQAERRQAESTLSAMISGRNIYSRLNEHRPPIRGLKWISEEELWVFTSTYIDSPLVQVDVFNIDGVYLRAFKADIDLSWAHYAGDTVWQLRENEEGVPQLVRSRYWIER